MHTLKWQRFSEVPGHFGAIQVFRKDKELYNDINIPSVIGRGYERPKSGDSALLGIQQQMNNLRITENGMIFLKRPKSSKPAFSFRKTRRGSSKHGKDESMATNEDTTSKNSTRTATSTTSNNSSCNMSRISFHGPNSSADSKSESDNSREVARRTIREYCPMFNVNTHHTPTRSKRKEKGIDKKDSCGFLRTVISELDRKEQNEEFARRKEKLNKTFNPEQTRKIQRENEILLQKLVRLEKNARRKKIEGVLSVSTTRKTEREREARRIRRDNARLSMKIHFARPSEELLRASELG